MFRKFNRLIDRCKIESIFLIRQLKKNILSSRSVEDLDKYLKRDIHAAEKVVLAPGSRALRDLLEESSESFHAPHLVQFAHRVEHRGLVVMVPETMSVRATQTLATGRDTDLHQTEHSVGMIDLVSTMSSRTNNPIIDNNKIKKKKKKN